MPKCELTHERPASEIICLSSDPLYLARPPKPLSENPTGEHSSILLNPAAANCFRVPGKSFAIMSRTGQVWQPIGMPNGLARSFSAPVVSKPSAAPPPPPPPHTP